MHPFGELSARRQELGAALRRLRKAAGLSGEAMATALSISQSQVSRMELGQQIAEPGVVDDWARAAGASDAERATLLGIAEAAAAEMVSWRKAMARGLARLQEDSREMEARATTILNFQTAGVPGLLQVPEYARRVFATERQATEADIAAAVAARMNRQAIVYSGAKHLEFVMTEAAVRWRPGPASLARAQVEKIIGVIGLENVTVGIIPQDAEVNVWHDHGFNILAGDTEGDETVVHVETLTRGLTITDPADVATYRDAFARLRKLAVTGDEARALLRQVTLCTPEPGRRRLFIMAAWDPSELAAELEELRRQFPGWQVWASGDTWCARPWPLINAGSAEDLAERIRTAHTAPPDGSPSLAAAESYAARARQFRDFEEAAAAEWALRKAEQAGWVAAAEADPVERFHQRYGYPAGPQARTAAPGESGAAISGEPGPA